MISLESIYSDLEENNAILFSYNLEDLSDGAIIKNSRGYGIFLDFSQYRTTRECKSALIHETSHCATGAMHQVSSPFEMITRNEYKACRRSYEKYLPPEKIQVALDAGYKEVWELSEWFDLPEDDIKKALHYWTECRGINFNGGV